VNALRRVLRAPSLWLALAGLQLLLAAGLAAPLRAVVRVAMGPFTIGDETHILAALLELVRVHPTVIATLVTSVGASAVLGLLLSPLLAGAVIVRLDAPRPVGELARAAVTHFPAALVIGIYGLVLRVLLALIAAALGTIHPTLQIVALVASLTLCALAVDLARARVVLDGARGLHPRTFVRAVVGASQPGLWLRSGLLTALQWASSLAILLAAVHGIGTAWSPWLVRGLAVLATFVALWRVAVAVDSVAARPRP
jgi:hypothetical protein